MFTKPDLLEGAASSEGKLRVHASEKERFYNDAWAALDAWIFDAYTQAKVRARPCSLASAFSPVIIHFTRRVRAFQDLQSLVGRYWAQGPSVVARISRILCSTPAQTPLQALMILACPLSLPTSTPFVSQ
jgi:hypothetical protein